MNLPKPITQPIKTIHTAIAFNHDSHTTRSRSPMTTTSDCKQSRRGVTTAPTDQHGMIDDRDCLSTIKSQISVARFAQQAVDGPRTMGHENGTISGPGWATGAILQLGSRVLFYYPLCVSLSLLYCQKRGVIRCGLMFIVDGCWVSLRFTVSRLSPVLGVY